MSTRWLAVAAFVALTGCQGQDPQPDAVPPDTSQYSVESATGPGAPPSQRIVVTNSLDEAMVLTAQYDGKTEQLGSVAARVDGEFFIQVPTGTSVTVIAADSTGAQRSSQVVTTTDSLARVLVR